MPPVLGPVSPSPIRLWSCAGASGTTCLPSLRQRKLISSPSRNSSITTCCAASPSSEPENRPLAASMAFWRESQMRTPLPAASPSALTTMGGWKSSMAFSNLVRSRADGVVAGGDVVPLQEALGKGLAALQHGRGAGGAKDAQAALLEGIHNAQ
jgi:hypothetical protein